MNALSRGRIATGRRSAAAAGLIGALRVVLAAGALVTLAVACSARADARAPQPGPALEPRMAPMVELGSPGGRKALPPAGVSNASLLLERGRFRPLPGVPGALQTTHLRNNNRGHVVGAYVEDSDGMPRPRGFLMRGRDVTRIDVPGALVTLPLGVNDRGQVVGSWVGQDATVNPVTGETGPSHGFVWDHGRYTKFDVPGSTSTAGYEINNRGQIVGNYTDAGGALTGTCCATEPSPRSTIRARPRRRI
jgi:hypothetical protein